MRIDYRWGAHPNRFKEIGAPPGYDYRAYRFGLYYARELYLQFLVLNDSKKASSDETGHES